MRIGGSERLMLENFGGNSYLRTQEFKKFGFGFGVFEPSEINAFYHVLPFLKPSRGIITIQIKLF